MNYVFKIEKLDIFESYFKGKVRIGKDEFTINIQNERRGKVLRLPFLLNTQKRVLVRCSGPGVSVEDFVEYRGESEWVEIDSDQITFYIADHQDQFDTIEIIELYKRLYANLVFLIYALAGTWRSEEKKKYNQISHNTTYGWSRCWCYK